MTDLQTEEIKNPEEARGSLGEQSAQIAAKGTRLPTRVREKLLQAGTPEFENRRFQILEEICGKYAWTAQQQGFVLRRNPLKQPPLKDYVFARIIRSEHAFLRQKWPDKALASRR
jgi:hypothetical protein